VIARNQVVGLIAGVVLIVAAVTGAWLAERSSPHASPEALVSSYLSVVYETGDAVKFVALFDAQGLEELATDYGTTRPQIQEQIQYLLDQIQEALETGATIEYELGPTEIRNGTTVIEVQMKASHPMYGDQEFSEIVPLAERDGRWYLHTDLLRALL